MKKIITLLICGLFLFNFPLRIGAEVGGCEVNCVAQTLPDYTDPNWISEANENNRNQITTFSTKNLFINSLYQNSYTSTIMQTCGYSIASSGCALTSVTMVSNFLNNRALTPVNVNSLMGNYACPFYWYEAESRLNIDVKLFKSSGLTTSYINSELYTQLNNNVPVIIGMTLANGSSHYVVVKGYNYSGAKYEFYINDPNQNSGKTTLNAYLSSGATIKQLIVYGK